MQENDDNIQVDGLVEDLGKVESYQGYKLENHNLDHDEFQELLDLHAIEPELLTNAQVKRLKKLSQDNIETYTAYEEI